MFSKQESSIPTVTLEQVLTEIGKLKDVLTYRENQLNQFLEEEIPSISREELEQLMDEIGVIKDGIIARESTLPRTVDELTTAIVTLPLKQSLDMIIYASTNPEYTKTKEFNDMFPPSLISYAHIMRDALFNSTLSRDEIRREIDTAYQRVVAEYNRDFIIISIADTMLTTARDMLKW